MTKDEILNMPAGKEIDALVAEKVMGWNWVFRPDNVPEYSNIDGTPNGRPKYIVPPAIPAYTWNTAWMAIDLPNYSTNISDAWEVVEKMMEDGDVFLEYWSDNEWFVANKSLGVRDDAIVARCDGKKSGKSSVSLAICRAALLAKLDEEQNFETQ
jgi:hypothetical protein